MGKIQIALLLSLTLIFSHAGYGEELGNYLNHQQQGRSVLVESVSGQKIRITPYGGEMLRVQIAEKGQAFTSDDRYEMVLYHDWPGTLQISENKQALDLSAAGSDGYRLRISKKPLRFTWFRQGKPVLTEKSGLVWGKRPGGKGKADIRTLTLDYQLQPDEHFAGSGGPDRHEHRPLDLRGHRVLNEYPGANGGRSFIPFYISSKGYGLFVNSSFSTQFDFGVRDRYQISLLNRSQADFAMDYFFIAGSNLMSVVQNYTQLTGKPRLFPRAFLGLQLTDRGGHIPGETKTHEDTWKHTVSSLREHGYPFDVMIFDNRWRANGGDMKKSPFEWSLENFPDPAEFGRYAKKEGVMVGLDLNRQINKLGKGWKKEYNVPGTFGKKVPSSVPDYTNPKVRQWNREYVFGEGLGPEGTYPMDALWIDSTDNISCPLNQKLHNGWTWDEVRNYYTFLIGKTFVDEGWDKIVGEKQRPFVWVRSGFPGVQRQMIHWTGDIKPDHETFEQQVVNLQAAGISGFAYFNHDAGGFSMHPSDDLYRQWTCAFASFTPIWRPHGSYDLKSHWSLKDFQGEKGLLYCKGSRRPDARPKEVQQDFLKYAQARYEMIPYIYTYAHESTATGTPMARAMFLEFDDEKAWEFPLQYMWGRQLLVAPNVKPGQNKEVWLPKGLWYDFWTKQSVDGNQVMNLKVPVGQMPVFAKAGSIITRAPYALSTQFIPKDKLMIDVYLGVDGQFTLVEDDNISEKFRKGEQQKTKMELKNEQRQFTVHAAQGTYDGAVNKKDFVITLYGLSDKPQLKVNGKDAMSTVWKASDHSLSITLSQQSTEESVIIAW